MVGDKGGKVLHQLLPTEDVPCTGRDGHDCISEDTFGPRLCGIELAYLWLGAKEGETWRERGGRSQLKLRGT